MKTIEDIKNEVAKEYGCKDWEYLTFAWAGFYEQIEPCEVEVSKRYALEAIKHDRERIKAMKEIDPVDGMETVSVYRIDNLQIELP